MNQKTFYKDLFLNNKIIVEETEKQKETLLPDSLNCRILAITGPLSNDSEKDLLYSIMKACSIGPTDFIELEEPFLWRNRKNNSIKEVLLFGIDEKELDLMIKLPKNWPTVFDNVVWIKTDRLENLIKDKNLKNDLWVNALKPYFLPS